MKKISFLLAMLASVAASAIVTVTPISTNYTVPPTVTFKVEWTNTPTAPYNSRVWVWVDFCSITGTTPGTFANAEISGATSSGNILTVSGNTRGFYVITNPSTVTATLSNASGKFNWCAYGSDYPPNVLANTNGSYTLAGTPPFKLIASNGTTAQTVTETIIATSAITITPATITDATGYPGLWCPYTGSDLYMDATHRCMERQSGAGNWEAWIKDNRDNELYRIVFMPDNKWWLAQNVKYALKGITINGCDKDSCGRSYTNVEVFAGNFAINQQTICPSGWVLPSNTQWNTMTNNISSNLVIAWQDMRSLQCSCKPITDRYGWATKGRSYLYEQMNDGDVYFSTDGNATHAMEMDQGNGDILTCNNTIYWGGKWGYPALYHVTVRCIHP